MPGDYRPHLGLGERRTNPTGVLNHSPIRGARGQLHRHGVCLWDWPSYGTEGAIGKALQFDPGVHHPTLSYHTSNGAIPLAAIDRYDALITKQSSGAFREGRTCCHAVSSHKVSLAEASP